MHIEEYEISRKVRYRDFVHKGKTWSLSDYPYLDIVMNDHCNARCKFCIAHLVHDKLIADIEVFKPKILYAIDTLGVKEVLIVGGEATINNDLFLLAEWLRTCDLRKICLTTNGHRLKDSHYRIALLRSGISHLNLSLMNINPEIQCQISGSKQYLTLRDLDDIYNEAHTHGVHVRINNNVFVHNHDTLDSMVQFYNIVRPFCDSVKFSPLLKTDAFSTVNEVTEFNRIHTLSDDHYDALWHAVEAYYEDDPILRNPLTFGFVEYSMILLSKPIVLNYNQHGHLMKKVVEEHKINNLKLLPTGDLSLSWNRELPQYFIA